MARQNRLDGTAGYAVLGRSNIREAPEATSLNGEPNRLRGLLSRGLDYGFVPNLVGPQPSSGNELVQVAWQAPQPFPEISDAANRFITSNTAIATRTDLRQHYWDQYSLDWGAIDSEIQERALYEPGQGFTEEEFDAAKRQLRREISALRQVKNYIAQIRAPFLDAGPAQIDLGRIADDIRRQFQPPDTSFQASPTRIAGSILTILGRIPGIGPLGGGLGVLGGALTVIGQMYDDVGAPILSAVNTRASGLGNELRTRYRRAATALTQLGLMIVSDYGKLNLVGGSEPGRPARITTPEWRWPADDAIVRGSLGKASRRWILSELMPVAWSLYDLPGVTTANAWRCTVDFGDQIFVRFPFRDTAPAGQYLARIGFQTNGQPIDMVRALGIPSTNLADSVRPPRADLVTPIFAPIDNNPDSVNLGLTRAQFYKPFPRRIARLNDRPCR